MTIETLAGYVLQDLFLNTLVNVCINKDLIVERIHESPKHEKSKIYFNILRGNNIEYRLEQTQEQSLPEEGQRHGRYSTVLYRLNGSQSPVIESSYNWISCRASSEENGLSERKTSLYQEDELGRAVLEKLKPLLK